MNQQHQGKEDHHHHHHDHDEFINCSDVTFDASDKAFQDNIDLVVVQASWSDSCADMGSSFRIGRMFWPYLVLSIIANTFLDPITQFINESFLKFWTMVRRGRSKVTPASYSKMVFKLPWHFLALLPKDSALKKESIDYYVQEGCIFKALALWGQMPAPTRERLVDEMAGADETKAGHAIYDRVGMRKICAEHIDAIMASYFAMCHVTLRGLAAPIKGVKHYQASFCQQVHETCVHMPSFPASKSSNSLVWETFAQTFLDTMALLYRGACFSKEQRCIRFGGTNPSNGGSPLPSRLYMRLSLEDYPISKYGPLFKGNDVIERQLLMPGEKKQRVFKLLPIHHAEMNDHYLRLMAAANVLPPTNPERPKEDQVVYIDIEDSVCGLLHQVDWFLTAMLTDLSKAMALAEQSPRFCDLVYAALTEHGKVRLRELRPVAMAIRWLMFELVFVVNMRRGVRFSHTSSDMAEGRMAKAAIEPIRYDAFDSVVVEVLSQIHMVLKIEMEYRQKLLDELVLENKLSPAAKRRMRHKRRLAVSNANSGGGSSSGGPAPVPASLIPSVLPSHKRTKAMKIHQRRKTKRKMKMRMRTRRRRKRSMMLIEVQAMRIKRIKQKNQWQQQQ